MGPATTEPRKRQKNERATQPHGAGTCGRLPTSARTLTSSLASLPGKGHAGHRAPQPTRQAARGAPCVREPWAHRGSARRTSISRGPRLPMGTQWDNRFHKHRHASLFQNSFILSKFPTDSPAVKLQRHFKGTGGMRATVRPSVCRAPAGHVTCTAPAKGQKGRSGGPGRGPRARHHGDSPVRR